MLMHCMLATPQLEPHRRSKENVGVNVVRAADLAGDGDVDMGDEDGDDILSAYGGVKPANKKQATPDAAKNRRLMGAAATGFSPASFKADSPAGKYSARKNAGSTLITFGDLAPIKDWATPMGAAFKVDVKEAKEDGAKKQGRKGSSSQRNDYLLMYT